MAAGTESGDAGGDLRDELRGDLRDGAAGGAGHAAPRPALGDPLALPDREAVLAHAADLILAAWRSFDHPRAGQPAVTAELRASLDGPLPEGPGDPSAALDHAARVLDASIAQSRPRFLAYVGSSGLEMGVLADALMASHDVNVAVEAGGAGLLEAQAVRWVSEFVGFGAPGGIMASGGMISNLTALAAAREHALPGSRRDGVAGRRLSLVCSAEVHYSVRRAAELLGIGNAGVRSVPIDARHRVDVDGVVAALRRDRADGITPVAVVANAGSTLTGAVDDLAALADVCAEEGVWLHVDGAYGLPAAASAAKGHLFAGLDRADSATVDAHKWMYVPKPCSVLLMRDVTALRRAFSHEETYMPHVEEEQVHGVDLTLEYSRPLRSLKLWLAMRVHGAAAVRDAIERNLAQAAYLAQLLTEDPAFELVLEPELSTVCFRHLPDGVDDLDGYHAVLADAIQADGDVYLAPARVDGHACLRACFVNHRTTDEDVASVLPTVARVGAAVLGGTVGGWER
ncbi:aminotransferase class V-fold PLP-dependent enzyme [Acidimicrobiaceae bacterium USS-CC1]|uniref:Aminotransferase class V-fold PLP-dependent enzyme n=1 Tax=Acidiferrimicrobium australe TaxID=2664430 RepID=A0ABW9QUW3_9ACTN|nr:aminotransferase class V-fold PLP-dependent enzyme [Acidiferrimicrobium australe]